MDSDTDEEELFARPAFAQDDERTSTLTSSTTPPARRPSPGWVPSPTHASPSAPLPRPSAGTVVLAAPSPSPEVPEWIKLDMMDRMQTVPDEPMSDVQPVWVCTERAIGPGAMMEGGHPMDWMAAVRAYRWFVANEDALADRGVHWESIAEDLINTVAKSSNPVRRVQLAKMVAGGWIQVSAEGLAVNVHDWIQFDVEGMATRQEFIGGGYLVALMENCEVSLDNYLHGHMSYTLSPSHLTGFILTEIITWIHVEILLNNSHYRDILNDFIREIVLHRIPEGNRLRPRASMSMPPMVRVMPRKVVAPKRSGSQGHPVLLSGEEGEGGGGLLFGEGGIVRPLTSGVVALFTPPSDGEGEGGAAAAGNKRGRPGTFTSPEDQSPYTVQRTGGSGGGLDITGDGLDVTGDGLNITGDGTLEPTTPLGVFGAPGRPPIFVESSPESPPPGGGVYGGAGYVDTNAPGASPVRGGGGGGLDSPSLSPSKDPPPRDVPPPDSPQRGEYSTSSDRSSTSSSSGGVPRTRSSPQRVPRARLRLFPPTQSSPPDPFASPERESNVYGRLPEDVDPSRPPPRQPDVDFPLHIPRPPYFLTPTASPPPTSPSSAAPSPAAHTAFPAHPASPYLPAHPASPYFPAQPASPAHAPSPSRRILPASFGVEPTGESVPTSADTDAASWDDLVTELYFLHRQMGRVAGTRVADAVLRYLHIRSWELVRAMKGRVEYAAYDKGAHKELVAHLNKGLKYASY